MLVTPPMMNDTGQLSVKPYSFSCRSITCRPRSSHAGDCTGGTILKRQGEKKINKNFNFSYVFLPSASLPCPAFVQVCLQRVFDSKMGWESRVASSSASTSSSFCLPFTVHFRRSLVRPWEQTALPMLNGGRILLPFPFNAVDDKLIHPADAGK